MRRSPSTSVSTLTACLAIVLLAALLAPPPAAAQEEAWYAIGCQLNWSFGGCACAELPHWPQRCREQYTGCIAPSFPGNQKTTCEIWCNGQYPDAYDQFCIATPSTTTNNTCWSCVSVTDPSPGTGGPGGGGPPPEEENQTQPGGEEGGGSVGGGCYMTRVCTDFPDGSRQCGPDTYYCD